MDMSHKAVAGVFLILAAACSSPQPETEESPRRVAGTAYTVKDTTVRTVFEASGTAMPLRQATLSTKLMGTVLEVRAREGDRVAVGQTLVRIDARDLAAKHSQVSASIAEAEAVRRDAATQAGRIRALYADSAATRAQLDAVETGLVRADAGVRAARASSAELSAVSAYATVRAPFAGIVTKRFVDPGAFAAPGAPLLTIQDGDQLRIVANATPDVASGLRRGNRIDALVENRPVAAVIEGIVPSATGNLYTINALVSNAGGSFLSGSTATLLIELGSRRALVIPSSAIIREGELTGVTIRTADGDNLRWIRLGRTSGDVVEVDSGLRAGDVIIVPATAAATVTARD
ncbi:MAG: efflux RND transporter periplasmic adaptor subunit [Gemmatimonadaceae bacterium]